MRFLNFTKSTKKEDFEVFNSINYYFLFYIKIHCMYFLPLLDSTNPYATPCLITSPTSPQTIGAYPGGGAGLFNGYIDQLQILFGTAKTASQILDDATLVAYYSMDCVSYSSWDSGPNQITGTAVGLTSGDGGRVGQSYIFNTNSSYFQATGLVQLGQSWCPFSFALWIRPIGPVTNGGTIVHVSATTTGIGWCLPNIGLSTSGQIVAGTWNGAAAMQVIGPVLTVGQWIHVAMTFSPTNGVRLYLNGVLYGSTGTFSYAPGGVPMTVTLGQPLGGLNNCATGAIIAGYYRGEIDEFHIYSRELAQADVTALANP